MALFSSLGALTCTTTFCVGFSQTNPAGAIVGLSFVFWSCLSLAVWLTGTPARAQPAPAIRPERVPGAAEGSCARNGPRRLGDAYLLVMSFTASALEWKNHYPRGTENVNGIPVHRASVKRTRNARVFASLSNVCFHEAHTREEEIAWVRENGPYSPELVKAVTAARTRFDRIFFYCYRYYHS